VYRTRVIVTPPSFSRPRVSGRHPEESVMPRFQSTDPVLLPLTMPAGGTCARNSMPGVTLSTAVGNRHDQGGPTVSFGRHSQAERHTGTRPEAGINMRVRNSGSTKRIVVTPVVHPLVWCICRTRTTRTSASLGRAPESLREVTGEERLTFTNRPCIGHRASTPLLAEYHR
jgi:hypothetical protein